MCHGAGSLGKLLIQTPCLSSERAKNLTPFKDGGQGPAFSPSGHWTGSPLVTILLEDVTLFFLPLGALCCRVHTFLRITTYPFILPPVSWSEHKVRHSDHTLIFAAGGGLGWLNLRSQGNQPADVSYAASEKGC